MHTLPFKGLRFYNSSSVHVVSRHAYYEERRGGTGYRDVPCSFSEFMKMSFTLNSRALLIIIVFHSPYFLSLKAHTHTINQNTRTRGHTQRVVEVTDRNSSKSSHPMQLFSLYPSPRPSLVTCSCAIQRDRSSSTDFSSNASVGEFDGYHSDY